MAYEQGPQDLNLAFRTAYPMGIPESWIGRRGFAGVDPSAVMRFETDFRRSRRINLPIEREVRLDIVADVPDDMESGAS